MNIKSSGRPIFIIGSGRSGTTLLQRMLGSHSKISSPTGESHFFIQLFRNQHNFGDLTQAENIQKVLEEMRRISREFVEEDLHGITFNTTVLAEEFEIQGADTIVKIIAALLMKNTIGENKTRWLEKTPYYILHIKTILKMFPNAQFIHIIRDGRDCALSMLGRKYDLKIFNTYHAAKIWKQYVDTGQQAKHYLANDAYYEIKYEDLIAAPEKNIKDICRFLGENFEVGMVNFKKSQDPKTKTPLLSKPIQKTNAEKWLSNMSTWQITVFESVAGRTLKRNNYPVKTKCQSLPLAIRMFFRLHEKYERWYGIQFRKKH